MNSSRIREIIAQARNEGRQVLLETEGMEILGAMGLRIPGVIRIDKPEQVMSLDLSSIGSDKVVIKAVSPDILHKSDVRAVDIVPKDLGSIFASLTTMEARLRDRYYLSGFSISEFIPHEKTLGNEILIGMRWTEDFGPVVSFGPGGIYAEFITKQLKPGNEIAIFSPELLPPGSGAVIEGLLQNTAIAQLLCGELRGQAPGAQIAKVRETIEKFLALAKEFCPGDILEFEVNPFAVSKGELVALDALVKLGRGVHAGALERPTAKPVGKIKNLLAPKTVSLVGVSEKGGPGRVILGNLLHSGFEKSAISILKPGSQEIEGCRCYPDVKSLPASDACVLVIPAAQVPDTITSLIEHQKAESLIVIPGGLEEKSGTEELVSRMHAAIAASRETAWGGPVINGGNCLGIRSNPGRINTLFIPEYKLPLSEGSEWPLAFISQSGAFAITRLNRIPGVNPRYTLTLGNQMDLTLGDYLTFLKDDPALKVFAVYVEGFKPMDGLSWMRAARDITRSGRKVILYRAGKTAAGAQASASHTASIAGDAVVTRELCRLAGVTYADTLDEFEDLMRLYCRMEGKTLKGNRLAVVSNAGFECVAAADSLKNLTLEPLSEELTKKITATLARSKIDQLVDVHNPLDLTPMCADADYAAVSETLLLSDEVDAAIIGCVPLTPALQTLGAGAHHKENAAAPEALAPRLVQIAKESSKPCVAVVDSGAIYDPFVRVLEEGGVPVYRSVDRAIRALERFREEKSGTSR